MRFTLVLIVLTLASCTNVKRTAKGKPLRNYSPGSIIKKSIKEEFTFDWLGMKMNVDFESNEEKQDFKATVRIRKDSIIWLSLAPAANIEMVRMIITPDSIKYISKIPGNKHYYLGTFDKAGDIAQMDLTFQAIQDILVGNAILLDKQQENHVSVIDKEEYFILTKFSRKLKKAIGLDEKDVLPNTVFEISVPDKKYEKLKKRSESDELTVKRHWFDGLTFKHTRAKFDDFYNHRSVEINYEDFKETDGQIYPSRGRLMVKTQETWQEIRFKISRISVGKPYDFEFTIPEDYERRWD